MSKNYNEVYSNFKWNVPENFNFGRDIVDNWAKKDPKKLALISINVDSNDATKTSFEDLSAQTNRFANVLKSNGIKKGDRVLIILESIPEWYNAMIGMIKLGVIPMPGTSLLTAHDVEYRLNCAEGTMVITDEKHANLIDEVTSKCPTLKAKMLVRSKKDGWISYEEEMEKASSELNLTDEEKTKTSDPMLIYFTSGTTGNPKMVLHTNAYPLGHEVTAKYCLGLIEGDIHWTVSDTGWAKAAWGKLFGQMIVGATIMQWETPGRFDADGLLKNMAKHNVTSFCAPPTVYRMLVQMDLTQYGLKFRRCSSAGEPLNPEVIKTWKDTFNLEIYDFFGQTETVCVLSNYDFMPIKFGSVGKPTPGHDIQIVDDDGNELPVNEEGNIAMFLGNGHPPGLCKEYWKSPDAMAAAFKGDYYYTGDRAYRDEEGYFWFVGRSDDVIKSSGYRIGPFEVESALVEHAAVAEAAVVGAEDPKGVRGTLVKAFVVLAKGNTPSDELTKEIQNYVKKVTAPYKYPRLVEYVDELPKTISGKILRRELRKK